MFRTVRLSIIKSVFTVHSAMVYVIQVCRQLSSRSICSCSTVVWRIPLLSVQWINSWWWTDELSETCRVLWQNKFVKLVHLVGFITKKVEMHLLFLFAFSFLIKCMSNSPPIFISLHVHFMFCFHVNLFQIRELFYIKFKSSLLSLVLSNFPPFTSI
jgi:hypothetical protein